MDALPHDHPLVVAALEHATIASREAAARLAAQGYPIRLAWIDPVPEFFHGAGPTPGRIAVDAYAQECGLQGPLDGKSGTMFLTGRTHALTTEDGVTLTLPVWRWGRRDIPCAPVCQRDQQGLACDDCGTGDYWLLPNYIIPAWEPGLSDPDNRHRLRPDIAMLMALGSKPIKVRWTDHARYSRGMAGRPAPDRVLRLMRVIAKPKDDVVVVKDRTGGESLVRPDQIRLKEPDPDPPAE